ncbi:MAG TPA: sodium ABC transporter ATP-binding protein [Clostridiales bacterium]|nr:sodium ABC transporter ATP-binding protein [Clostridiales bacterium]
MESILKINNLSKKYGEFSLENISFKLEPGYIMGFIGPNGAGKTTTIKLIMNLIQKDSGEVKIFDEDLMDHEVKIKDRIGFVYDQCNYYETFKIKDNVKLIAPFYSKWNWNTFDNYLKRFKLNPDQKLSQLSQGMKIKFQLAIALSHDADFLLMDEPTSGLDPVFRSEILDILKEYIEQGERSVLFSTHITTDLEKIADYVTFINDGQMVFSTDKDNILDQYAIVKGGLDLLNEEFKANLVGLRKNAFGFEGLTNKKDQMKNRFKETIMIEKASLEDIMVYTVGGIR